MHLGINAIRFLPKLHRRWPLHGARELRVIGRRLPDPLWESTALRRAASQVDVFFGPSYTLPALYSAAQFFVFPASEAEGFGLPVVEAMACGTPVVTTAQGSLREIAPGAAVTTKEPSVAELSVAIRGMATDEALRVDLAARGIERAKEFTWKITARKTLDVLWEVAKS
jgi:glycosyltransferase involved in cell wall biosynthesis